MLVAIIFDPFHFLWPSVSTMTTPTIHPSHVLPETTYQDYFSRTETNTFHGRYTAVLEPYIINLTSATAMPANVL